MLLNVKDLTKKFNHRLVVNNINLTIEPGELVAFLGPNGAGKSTTINMLTGIIEPTTGSIELNGLTPRQVEYHQAIGVVFQNSVLDNELTVEQNLRSRQAMYHEITRPWDFWIEKFNLQKIINQKYQTLSGGQKRRVDIVRALLHDPKLLFLDEPTTGLDIQTRTLIWQVLTELRQETGLTIVLTTHYLEEAELANFIYVINHGQIIAADTVSELKQKFVQNILTLYTDEPQILAAKLSNFQCQVDSKSVTVFAPENKVLGILNKLAGSINDFEYRRGNMDDIFLSLTGKGVE